MIFPADRMRAVCLALGRASLVDAGSYPAPPKVRRRFLVNLPPTPLGDPVSEYQSAQQVTLQLQERGGPASIRFKVEHPRGVSEQHHLDASQETELVVPCCPTRKFRRTLIHLAEMEWQSWGEAGVTRLAGSP